MKLYKNGLVARNGKFEKTDFLVSNGKFEKVALNIKADCEIVDLCGKKVFPKLFEEHTHGANGGGFNVSPIEDMPKIMDFYLENHIGTVFPTVMTDDIEVMKRQLSIISEFSKGYKEIKGIHLEGPFLAEAFKGAMPSRFLLEPDKNLFDEFQKFANGMIKLITIAPEKKGAATFVSEVVKEGVAVNIGHSGATYEQVMKCIDAGADGFTHTFNGMKLMHQHFPSVGGAALLSDIYCETICDGRHLNPVTVQILNKVKSIDQLILITDSIMAAGLPDGQYKLGVNNVTVLNGDATITENGERAGGTLNPWDGVKNFSKWTGVPIEKAIKGMTENPAKHTGLFEVTGSIDEGKLAEFFIR